MDGVRNRLDFHDFVHPQAITFIRMLLYAIMNFAKMRLDFYNIEHTYTQIHIYIRPRDNMDNKTALTRIRLVWFAGTSL